LTYEKKKAKWTLLFQNLLKNHPLQSAQESCIIVCISLTADLPIASSFSVWLKNPAFVSISLWVHLSAACPSICSTILHLLQFSMGRSSYCILFNLLKNPALLFQLLQFSLGRSPYLHSLQSAQESCIIVSISLLPFLLNCINFNSAQESCIIVSIASILSGQIFLMHSLQSAQESYIIVSISVWPDLPYCINFNLLKNSALFQFLYGQIFHITCSSIHSRTFAFALKKIMGRSSYCILFNLLKNLALLQGLGFRVLHL